MSSSTFSASVVSVTSSFGSSSGLAITPAAPEAFFFAFFSASFCALVAALAAALLANFFFLSRACFAFKISSSHFISFSFVRPISSSLAGVTFLGFLNSYSLVTAESLMSGLDFKSFPLLLDSF
ncbi:hypothetical protein V8G54_001669 [Vigna mungo]|uniref:Uncharacterized protein n=1 Tax=Vigna mungo TaxID=3915 RepID=A0AAQ3P8Q3_VIGMU